MCVVMFQWPSIIIGEKVKYRSGNDAQECKCLFLFQHDGIVLKFVLNLPTDQGETVFEHRKYQRIKCTFSVNGLTPQH